MALSLGLGKAGLTADSIDTKAVVTLDKDGDGFSITAVHLTCKAKVPGADAATFDKIAQATKLAARCPRCSRRPSRWTPAWKAELPLAVRAGA